MNKEMKELAAWTIKKALKEGSSACRVNLSQDRSVEVSYRNRKPENIKESSTKSLRIEFFVNNRYSSQSTSDLRKNELEKFISDGVASTRLLGEDPDRTLPDPEYYKGRAEIDLELHDAAYSQYSPENRHQIARAIEAGCMERGGEKTISVTADVSDGYYEGLMMASNGFEGFNSGNYYSFGAVMTAQDKGDRRPNGYHYVSGVKRADLPKPEEIGRTAAEKTLAMLGAKKLKTETLPVIIENQNVARFFSGVLSAMTGASIQQKRSFLHDKKNTLIASEKLTLIDEPHLKKSFGSRLYDSDGIAARKRTIIDKGILKDFYIDWYYSRKLEWEPTTGSPSNLVIPAGSRSVAEIMKDLGRGMLITGFIGGNSNPTTGDASIGIVGCLFENGELTQPVSEMNLADNHLHFWKKLIEAANDPWPYSGWRFPSLVFKDVVVAGV